MKYDSNLFINIIYFLFLYVSQKTPTWCSILWRHDSKNPAILLCFERHHSMFSSKWRWFECFLHTFPTTCYGFRKSILYNWLYTNLIYTPTLAATHRKHNIHLYYYATNKLLDGGLCFSTLPQAIIEHLVGLASVCINLLADVLRLQVTPYLDMRACSSTCGRCGAQLRHCWLEGAESGDGWSRAEHLHPPHSPHPARLINWLATRSNYPTYQRTRRPHQQQVGR